MADPPESTRGKVDRLSAPALLSIGLAVAATIPGSVAAITDPLLRSLVTILAVLVILAMGERASKKKR